MGVSYALSSSSLSSHSPFPNVVGVSVFNKVVDGEGERCDVFRSTIWGLERWVCCDAARRGWKADIGRTGDRDGGQIHSAVGHIYPWHVFSQRYLEHCPCIKVLPHGEGSGVAGSSSLCHAPGQPERCPSPACTCAAYWPVNWPCRRARHGGVFLLQSWCLTCCMRRRIGILRRYGCGRVLAPVLNGAARRA